MDAWQWAAETGRSAAATPMRLDIFGGPLTNGLNSQAETRDMTPTSLPPIFGALSDPTRLAIVERLLAEGERTAGEVAAPFAMSRPAISKHLRVLEAAGLIERRVERQWRVVRVRVETVRAVDQWIGRYRHLWETTLDRLAVFDEGNAEGTDDGE